MNDNIKLPPMPETEWKLHMPAKYYEAEWTSTQSGYTEADMENYAREAVRLNAQAVPCCTNYAAGTTCFSDPKENCPMLSAAPQPAQSAGNHRPDRQWYERMIQETLDDDFEIGPAFDEKVKDSAAPAAAPQPTQQPLTAEQIYDLYRRAGLEAYHLRDTVVQSAYDRCINDFARLIEQAHRIGVKSDR